MAKGSPMMEQYQAIKNQNPDSLLLFRLGDFYELFGEDAKEASQLLGLTLTARTSGEGRSIRVPMAGMPYHAAAGYIQKLLRAGRKVAVVEQMEDPKAAKGNLRRELVRIITPGTALDEGYLESKSNNYVLALAPGKKGHAFAYADNTTGAFFYGLAPEAQDLEAELARIKPSEIVFPEGSLDGPWAELLEPHGALLSPLDSYSFSPSESERVLREHFAVASLEGFGLNPASPELGAAGALFAYLKKTQKSPLSHFTQLQRHESASIMRLDAATRRHLELSANQDDGGKRGTLFEVLDRTCSAAGGRLLKRWIHEPLNDLKAIEGRLDAVEELKQELLFAEALAQALKSCTDIERVMGKVGCLAASARDLASLRQTLRELPGLAASLSGRKAALLRGWEKRERFKALRELLDKAIIEDPPLSIRDAGMLRTGYSAELDQIIADSHGGRDLVLEIQEKERARSGNPKLKVQFNNIFGFYIEVSKAQADSVPPDYERKQTLVNAERFTTPELKAIELRVLSAEERRKTLELALFEEIRGKVAIQSGPLLELAQALAELDALQSLASAARELDYVRPSLSQEPALEIEAGRHPVVEFLMRGQGGSFVANDCRLDTQAQQLMLITGPNMAGKSTYMRQVALISLMGQIGSFVPAKKARLGLVDQLFTRVGASDRLSRGMSTFLVEMTETANILRHASRQSLVILDEIGRGTSTYDGVSIAWSVAEYLHEAPNLGCRTLFATHYFELTELEALFPRIKNFSVAVREWQGRILFQHEIKPGASEHSYGIAVAKLAGVPEAVLKRSKEVLARLEKAGSQSPSSSTAAMKGRAQIDLFSTTAQDPQDAETLQRLRDLDPESLTPLQALQELVNLKEKVLSEKSRA
jgi:DNA mismatch repair protein MutS